MCESHLCLMLSCCTLSNLCSPPAPGLHQGKCIACSLSAAIDGLSGPSFACLHEALHCSEVKSRECARRRHDLGKQAGCCTKCGAGKGLPLYVTPAVVCRLKLTLSTLGGVRVNVLRRNKLLRVARRTASSFPFLWICKCHLDNDALPLWHEQRAVWHCAIVPCSKP